MRLIRKPIFPRYVATIPRERSGPTVHLSTCWRVRGAKTLTKHREWLGWSTDKLYREVHTDDPYGHPFTFCTNCFPQEKAYRKENWHV